MLCRKRTKKAQSKVGRKKSKKTTPQAENVATPRIRAATAREAAAAREAARAAEEAAREAASAREAARATEEAAREATGEADQATDAVAREAVDVAAREAADATAREAQAEASSAKRRLDLDPVPLVVAGPSVPLEALTKKLTPRKKLATKVKKS
jgi:translation initiation factor IF-2